MITSENDSDINHQNYVELRRREDNNLTKVVTCYDWGCKAVTFKTVYFMGSTLYTLIMLLSFYYFTLMAD